MHFWEFDWHETLSLLAGLLSDPLPLLRAIMGQKDDIFRHQLLLAGKCVAECKESKDELIGEVIDKVYELWNSAVCYSFFSRLYKPLVVLLGKTHSQMRNNLQRDCDNFQRLPFHIQLALEEIQDEHTIIDLVKVNDANEKFSKPTTSYLIADALNSINKEEKKIAIKALGNIGDSQALPALISILDSDTTKDVRQEVVEALGKIRDPQVLPVLISHLDDTDELVRMAAAVALAKTGRLDAFKQILQNPNIDIDSNDWFLYPLLRKLAVRHSKAKVDFIPVYPETIERLRQKSKITR